MLCRSLSARMKGGFVMFQQRISFLLPTDDTNSTNLFLCSFVSSVVFFNIGLHGFHGFNYLCNLFNLLTFIIQFHGYSYLRVLRVLRWQSPHDVRCFTHLFCTFIGGKFEVLDWQQNHRLTVSFA